MLIHKCAGEVTHWDPLYCSFV